MKLVELTINSFLDKTAGSDPVPGGGSVSALCAALAASLAEMVANLTIGRKKYEECWSLMEDIARWSDGFRKAFILDIDADSDAYNAVFEAFKLPKETDEQKAVRSQRIQEATKTAAEVPLEVARKALALMDIIVQVYEKGNQNAMTDAAVAMMATRTAALGALLNVRINLSSIKDEAYRERMSAEVKRIETESVAKEAAMLADIRNCLKSTQK